jgi:hypothetical protein
VKCISPLKAGFDSQGNIIYNSKKMSPELVPFEFPCRKCLACRLNIGREKAVRAMHEAQMHENNIFLTLTYSEEHLESPRLVYKHFQDFMKRLREHVTREAHTKEARDERYISYMVTGEYGDKTKRPHWHAILFNYRPEDSEKHYITDLGHTVWRSDFINKLWGKGHTEFGDVTLESAGYVARYAAKKLTHGKDEDHDYHPIHKTSAKRAIGRSWIEKYYKHTFAHGFVVLPNGEKCRIPRYYTDWLKKYKFDDYIEYVNGTRDKITKLAEKKARKEEMEYLTTMFNKGVNGYKVQTKAKVKETILKQKFKKLQEYVKL